MFEGQRITVLPATTDRWVDFDKLMGEPGGYWGPLAPSTDGPSADFRAAFSPAGNPAPDRGGKRRYRNRIRDSAAEKMNIMGEGQTLRAERSADLDKAYLSLHAELQHDGYIYWANTADVPLRYENSIISLVAAARATKFGVGGDRLQMIQTDEVKGWRTLFKLSQVNKMGTTEIENF